MSRDPMRMFDIEQFTNKTNENPETGLKDVKDWVADKASEAKDKAGQAADAVSEKLGAQRTNAADTLDRVASTMHEKADSVPAWSKAGNLTHRMADGIESTASYLRDHDFKQMGKDATNICRRYPTQSVIAALAFGFLLGRSARRK